MLTGRTASGQTSVPARPAKGQTAQSHVPAKAALRSSAGSSAGGSAPDRRPAPQLAPSPRQQHPGPAARRTGSAPAAALAADTVATGSALVSAPPSTDYFDGRVRRTLQSLQDSLEKSQEVLRAVKDCLSSPPANALDILGSSDALNPPRTQMKLCLADSWKQLKNTSNRLTADSVRLAKSPLGIQPVGAELTTQFDAASGETKALLELFTLVSSGSKFPDHAYVEAFEACSRSGIALPGAFQFKLCSASVAHLLSADEVDKAVQAARTDSVEVTALLASGVPQPAAWGFVSNTIQNVVLAWLNAVVPRAAIHKTEAGERRERIAGIDLEFGL